MGFCLIWKLRTLQRVLGFVFWSWAFGLAFFQWVFFDGFLFSLKVEDLTTSSWICILKLGLRPSFFFNDKFYVFLDLDDGRWGLRSSIGLVTLRLGLRPSFILNHKVWLFLDLDDGALDLSLMKNYEGFWTWMMGRWTWSLEADPSASSLMRNYHCFRTWMMGRWTFHLEAGPSAQLHS